MRTASEMYEYTVANKYGTGTIKSSTRKHFDVVAGQLHADEQVLMAFVGLHEQKGSDLQGNFAYAITNKRFIMGQKGVLGRNKIKTILLENLNDVTVKNGIVWRNIEFDTIKDHFIVQNNTNTSKELGSKVQEAIFSFKNSRGNITQSATEPSTVDQLREYKQLMDEGIISQEEFDQKKREFLSQ